MLLMVNSNLYIELLYLRHCFGRFAFPWMLLHAIRNKNRVSFYSSKQPCKTSAVWRQVLVKTRGIYFLSYTCLSICSMVRAGSQRTTFPRLPCHLTQPVGGIGGNLEDVRWGKQFQSLASGCTPGHTGGSSCVSVAPGGKCSSRLLLSSWGISFWKRIFLLLLQPCGGHSSYLQLLGFGCPCPPLGSHALPTSL